MRGRRIDGSLNEGDWVEVPNRRWRDGIRLIDGDCGDRSTAMSPMT
jgi:hypothetical protein